MRGTRQSAAALPGLLKEGKMAGLRVKFIILGVVFLAASLFPTRALAQGVDTALLRGTVSDPSGAVIPAATVTMTDDATKVATKTASDEAGRYTFNALKPASYTATVEAQGFRTLVHPSIVLRVGQQSDLDFTLAVGQRTETVEVTGTAALLNTVSGALGTQVPRQYLINMPLEGRNIANLTYLTPGITEVSGCDINCTGGTNFASNGQRYATAEFRLDGALITTPEGGEGGSTNGRYMPSVEALQEFTVQNNSYSAEYGNNGGTVVTVVTKSGTNQFHGSGWEFMRRPGFDANDFFSNSSGSPKGTYRHDQYGASIGGPIQKGKTFFFFDYERFRDNAPNIILTSVPTIAERTNGDFSQLLASGRQLYNPFQVACTGSGLNEVCNRAPIVGNIIPKPWDPIGANLLNLYPMPNLLGDAQGFGNFGAKEIYANPSYQFDLRMDHNFSEKSRLSARYSQNGGSSNHPDPYFLEPTLYGSYTHNITLEHNWSATPTLLWVNRIAVIRQNNPETTSTPVDPLSVGFPAVLVNNSYYGEKHFPNVSFDDGYQALGLTNGCCTDTIETDTQWLIDSQLTRAKGRHNMKFGFEKRIFFNSFWQPDNTSGDLYFGPTGTAQSVFSPDSSQGNGLASLLLGWQDVNSGGVTARPRVANKSGETAFYVQDDWRATDRLTLNLGLRYEWSTPYSERFNRNMFSCFNCDSGVSVPGVELLGLSGTDYGPWAGREIFGTTQLATASHRHANSDLNNVAPRLGFAYRLGNSTVIRGGAGVYYGLSFATNWQYGGRAWNKYVSIPSSLDGGITACATLENPYPLLSDPTCKTPGSFIGPPGGKYGTLTNWGYDNDNHGSNTFQNAEIYQWNFGIERQLPGQMILDLNYSANRSTHLPWNYSTENRNFIDAKTRETLGPAALGDLVPNPFRPFFVSVNGSKPLFSPTDISDSIYTNAYVPLGNLLHPFPQFTGSFSGFPLFVASSSYHSFQARFEKRASHGVTFLGAYTFSKFLTNSDAGGNAWIGNLGFVGAPQDLTNLRAEKSVSGNDTPQRFVFAVVYELPVGRGKPLGRGMSRLLDAVVGGWQINTFTTFQSGQPLTIFESNNLLTDGHQRPNVTGNPCSGTSIHDVVSASLGSGPNLNANYFNSSVLSDPAPEFPGSAPRYFSNCRVQGINNTDLGISKRFIIKENMYIEARADAFNAFNRSRFGIPQEAFGDPTFGEIFSQANNPRHGQVGVRFVF
jgi:carboxypeptidase family protein/TonB-dependent receptor-like protein